MSHLTEPAHFTNRTIVYAIRTFHFLIGITMTASVTYLWYAALYRRYDWWLALSLVALAVQGVALMLNKGDCPLGNVSARYGDRKTLFELVAGKQYAIHGMRNFGIFIALGIIVLVVRYFA